MRTFPETTHSYHPDRFHLYYYVTLDPLTMTNTTTMANTFRAHHDSDSKCLSITNQNQMGSIFLWMTDDHMATHDGDKLQGMPPWPHIHTWPMDVYNNRCNMELLFDTMAPTMQLLPWNTWHSHSWMQTEGHSITGPRSFSDHYWQHTPHDKHLHTLAKFKYNDAMDTTTNGCLSCNCRSAMWMEHETQMNTSGSNYFSYTTSMYGVWGGSHII